MNDGKQCLRVCTIPHALCRWPARRYQLESRGVHATDREQMRFSCAEGYRDAKILSCNTGVEPQQPIVHLRVSGWTMIGRWSSRAFEHPRRQIAIDKTPDPSCRSANKDNGRHALIN